MNIMKNRKYICNRALCNVDLLTFMFGLCFQNAKLHEASFTLNMDYSNKRTKFKIMSVQKDVSTQVHMM